MGQEFVRTSSDDAMFVRRGSFSSHLPADHIQVCAIVTHGALCVGMQTYVVLYCAHTYMSFYRLARNKKASKVAIRKSTAYVSMIKCEVRNNFVLSLVTLGSYIRTYVCMYIYTPHSLHGHAAQRSHPRTLNMFLGG